MIHFRDLQISYGLIDEALKCEGQAAIFPAGDWYGKHMLWLAARYRMAANQMQQGLFIGPKSIRENPALVLSKGNQK